MTTQTSSKWRHFEAEFILLCVHWYLRHALSYRDLEEIMQARCLHEAPELQKRCHPISKPRRIPGVPMKPREK